MSDPILVPVSAGELLDKKTILEIKRERLKDASQLANVEREWQLLAARAAALLQGPHAAVLAQMEGELLAVNTALWDLENTVRHHERTGDFGQGFVTAARGIYAGNDRRAAVKKRINLLLGSAIVEEKSHER